MQGTKVFIGWSGERSQALGQALHDWLPLVLHYVEPWLSEADIAAGERWAQTLGQELETANFGIVCLTHDNVASPWVLFEAGSLAKSLEVSRVIPLLLDLDISGISGPLAQFQAKKATKDGMREVVQSINRTAPEREPDQRVTQLFDALWPQFETKVTSISEQTVGTKQVRPQHEILEELVAGFRSVDTRISEVMEMVASSRMRGSRRFGRMHPMMVHEISMMIGEGPGDPTPILVFASMFRDELPWLYELGMDAYKSVKAGSSSEASSAVLRFRRVMRVIGLLRKGQFAEELGVDPRMLDMLIHEFERFYPAAERDDPPPTKRTPRREPGEGPSP